MTQKEYLMRMFGKLREAAALTGKLVIADEFDRGTWKAIEEAIFEAGIARAGYIMSINGAIVKQDEENEPAIVDHKLEFAKWLQDHGRLDGEFTVATKEDATLVDQESNDSAQVR